MTETPEKPARLSRRKLMERIAAGAAAVPLIGAAVQGQTPPAPGAAPAPGTAGAAPGGRGGRGGGGGRGPRNGHGPIKVLLIAGDHPYDYDQFFAMFDTLGEDITWNFVTQPAAEKFFDPDVASGIDVFVLYDRAGRDPLPPGVPNIHEEGDRTPQGRNVTYRQPSAALKRGIKAMLTQGKGMVLLHHSIASWVHTWPEYVEMMGGACDWDYPQTIRGVKYPYSGFRGGVQQHITAVEPTHPIVAGLENGFDITDEVYLCPIFPENFHPLLKTDFVPIAANFPMQVAAAQAAGTTYNHPPGVPYSGWYRAVENSPMAYIQHGHDNNAWSNPSYQKLVLNAIKWAASPAGHSWARANRKTVFT